MWFSNVMYVFTDKQLSLFILRRTSTSALPGKALEDISSFQTSARAT